MSDCAISVENLGKRYRIGARQQKRTFREALTDRFMAPLRYGARMFGGTPAAPDMGRNRIIWALQDINFSISKGEAVGLIGCNGSGKSTLLRVLSRITDPTTGSAGLRGRVSGLLEVGTGFHPELTGRENVYLNGAILGMKKTEMDRKFDKIVEFAEVGEFIDTPVKRYSSGMSVRLAFSVAAHLDSEILLVDEVLAVGDAAFQEKCMGSMESSASGGRTVVLVSHNMSSIQHLCKRAILLEKGRLKFDGPAEEAVRQYLSRTQQGGSVSLTEWHDRICTGAGRLTLMETLNSQGERTDHIRFGEPVTFVLHAEFSTPVVDPAFIVLVHTGMGDAMLDIRSIHDGLRLGRVQGKIVIRVTTDALGLYPGRYLLSPAILDAGCSHYIDFPRFCGALDIATMPGPHGDLKLQALWGKYWVRSKWDKS